MDNFLWLNADGTLIPEDAETRAMLGTQQAHFRLQPTSSNLLIGIRTPCEPGHPEGERVILAGDATGLPLVDMIVFLNQCRITGLFRLTSPDSERTLSFLDGEIRGASSSIATEKIGEVAVRMGFVQRERLEALLASPTGTGRIGNLMVENGLIQRHDLYACLRQQVTEIFLACLMVTEGVFTLTNQKIAAQRALNINTQGLLMDSVRQMDELKEFRKRIPSSKVCPRALKTVDASLEKAEAQILLQCNGERSISELALMFRLSEFDATKAVHHLLELGYVDSEMKVAPGAPPVPMPAEVISVFNKVFVMIFSVLRALPRPPDILDEASNVLRLQSELFPMFRGIQLEPSGEVPAHQLMQNIQELNADTPETSHVLYSTFNELMYFLLFEAGEQLDPVADEQLSARIKVLLDPIEAASR